MHTSRRSACVKYGARTIVQLDLNGMNTPDRNAKTAPGMTPLIIKIYPLVEQGLCRKRPPVASTEGTWPAVVGSDWCGEFSPALDPDPDPDPDPILILILIRQSCNLHLPCNPIYHKEFTARFNARATGRNLQQAEDFIGCRVISVLSQLTQRPVTQSFKIRFRTKYIPVDRILVFARLQALVRCVDLLLKNMILGKSPV